MKAKPVVNSLELKPPDKFDELMSVLESLNKNYKKIKDYFVLLNKMNQLLRNLPQNDELYTLIVTNEQKIKQELLTKIEEYLEKITKQVIESEIKKNYLDQNYSIYLDKSIFGKKFFLKKYSMKNLHDKLSALMENISSLILQEEDSQKQKNLIKKMKLLVSVLKLKINLLNLIELCIPLITNSYFYKNKFLDPEKIDINGILLIARIIENSVLVVQQFSIENADLPDSDLAKSEFSEISQKFKFFLGKFFAEVILKILEYRITFFKKNIQFILFLITKKSLFNEEKIKTLGDFIKTIVSDFSKLKEVFLTLENCQAFLCSTTEIKMNFKIMMILMLELEEKINEIKKS